MIQPNYYSNEIEYLETCTSLVAKLTATEAIMSALMTQMLVIATGQPVKEYSLSDQHTTIRRSYRTSQEIMTMYNALELQANELRRQLRKDGVRRMVDGKNLIGRRGY